MVNNFSSTILPTLLIFNLLSVALTDPHKREKALRLLCLLLPPIERHVLQALFDFLGQVAEREKYNKMTLNNVAMIFAPNLFPPTLLQKFSPAGDQEGFLNQQVIF